MKTRAWTWQDRDHLGRTLRAVSVVLRFYALGSLLGAWLDHGADVATFRARILVVMVLTAVGYAFLAVDMKLRPVIRRWI